MSGSIFGNVAQVQVPDFQATQARAQDLQLRRQAMQQQNALTQFFQQNGQGFASPDAGKRMNLLAMLASQGGQGAAMAMPQMQALRNQMDLDGPGPAGQQAAAPEPMAEGGAPQQATQPRQAGAGMAVTVPADLEPIIREEAARFGIPYEVAARIVRQESNFNPAARGRAGEVGLMQIMPSTARQPGWGMAGVDPATLSDPRANIRFGLDYFSRRGRARGVTDFNDPEQRSRALLAYNGGGDPNYVQNVERWQVGGAPSAQGATVPASNGDTIPAQNRPPGAGGAQPGGEAAVGIQRTPGGLVVVPGLDMRRVENAHRQPGNPAAAPVIEMYQRALATHLQTVGMTRRGERQQPPTIALGAGQHGPEGMYERVPVSPDNPNGLRYIGPRPEQTPQTVGTIPPGYQLQRGEGGAMQMVPIPGGPAELADRRAREQETARRTGAERTGNVVVQDLDRTLSILDSSTLPVAGFSASTLARIPGTGAADAARLLESVRSNVGFAQLNQMRQESPSGAGLGSVTERELQLLQSVLGSLDQTQSPRQFRDNLMRVRNTFLDIVHGPGQGPPRQNPSFQQGGGAPAGARAPDAAPEIAGPGGQGTAAPPPRAATRTYNPRTGRIE